MKEANPVKFYLAKYFFLALGLLQGLAALLLFLNGGQSPKAQFTSFALFTVALVMVAVYFLTGSKIKRVAISKKKLAVKDRAKIKRYDWEDVKMMKFIPFLNMYCMKLKGKKSKIYFLPTSNSESLFGLFHTTSDFVSKKVSKV